MFQIGMRIFQPDSPALSNTIQPATSQATIKSV